MKLDEAKNWANDLSKKHGLIYYVHELNPNSYVTFSETHFNRHTNMSYVYKTNLFEILKNQNNKK